MVRMHMNTNARIVSKVLTRNKNTFYALKELINKLPPGFLALATTL